MQQHEETRTEDWPSVLVIISPGAALELHEDAPWGVPPSKLAAAVKQKKPVAWENQGRVCRVPHAVIRNALSCFRTWAKQMAVDPRSSAPIGWNLIHWWQCSPLGSEQPPCQFRSGHTAARNKRPDSKPL